MAEKAKVVEGNIFIFLADPEDPCPDYLYEGRVTMEGRNFTGEVAGESGRIIKLTGMQANTATIVTLEERISIVLSRALSFPKGMQIPAGSFSFSGVYGLVTENVATYAKKARVLSLLKI
jgi:hypothetical protein